MNRRVWLAMAAVGLVLGCSPVGDDPLGIRARPTNPPGPRCTRGGAQIEEEILGCLHNVPVGNYTVDIQFLGGATQPGYATQSMGVDRTSSYANGGAQFGWFGVDSPSADYGPCNSGSDVNANGPELHGGGAHETHCIQPGRFQLTLRDGATILRTWTLDWGSFPLSAGGHAMDSCLGCVPTSDVGGQYDVFVDYDGSGIPRSEPAAVEVAYGLSLSDPNWTPATFSNGSYHIPSGTVARISAYPSNPSPVSGYLGTFLWRMDGVPAYSNVNPDMIITHQLQGLSGTTSRTVYVLHPTGEEVSVPVSITVDAGGPPPPAPTACATFEGMQTFKGTDQIFSASCSQGSNLVYRWRTEATGAFTPYSSDPNYEFMGHWVTGNQIVTLEVKDQATGLTNSHNYTFLILNNSLTISGPAYITTKAQYNYSVTSETGTAGFWFAWWERFSHDPQWYGPDEPYIVHARVWSAGCYYVDQRVDASSGGTLIRGRQRVTVAIGDCGGPPQ